MLTQFADLERAIRPLLGELVPVLAIFQHALSASRVREFGDPPACPVSVTERLAELSGKFHDFI
jgi:hypothetical protein